MYMTMTYSIKSFCSFLGTESLTVTLGCLFPEINDIRALVLAERIKYMKIHNILSHSLFDHFPLDKHVYVHVYG
jgi:hypothetical protein